MLRKKYSGKLKRIVEYLLVKCRNQSGFSLVESLIAVAILGSTVFMLLGGLNSGTIALGIQQQGIIAENLGRSQLEYTKGLPYQTAPHIYTQITEVPSDYSITAEASVIPGKDENIQKILITVYRNEKSVYTLEGYKVNR